MVQVNVYGDAKATCTQRVLLLLEELSLKYELQSIDLSKREQRGEEFMKLQPFGKVPAVEYDDRVLFESRSILRYIAKNNNDIHDLLGDVDTDIWLEVESQNYNPHVSKIVNERLFKKWRGEKPDKEIVENELRALEAVLDVYEKRLSESTFIGGDEFSIADISHIPYTNYMLRCGYKELYKSRPNVYRWVKQIIKRSSVQNVIGDLK